MRIIRIVAISLFIVWNLSAGAAVKTEEKTQVQFEGFLGRMTGMFGGKAAKEGATETVSVKGNRKRTATDAGDQIIDLDEEKIYDLDLKGKSYRVTTFEELRRKMQEAQAQQAPQGAEMQIDYDLKDSGQHKTINSYDCREVVMTIAVHEKGKKLEDNGGLLLTASHWLTPAIPAMKEIQDFDRRFFQKLALAFDPALMQQMAAAFASNPFLKDAMAKLQEESAKLDGTMVLTTSAFQGVQSKEQMAQQAQAKKEDTSTTNIPTSVGGLFGGIGRKLAQKKMEEKPSESATPQTPGRSTIMTSTHELLKVSSDVADADLAIPAGFKEKK